MGERAPSRSSISRPARPHAASMHFAKFSISRRIRKHTPISPVEARDRYEAPWLAPLVPLYAAATSGANIRSSRGWERTRRLRCPVIERRQSLHRRLGEDAVRDCLAQGSQRTGIRG